MVRTQRSAYSLYFAHRCTKHRPQLLPSLPEVKLCPMKTIYTMNLIVVNCIPEPIKNASFKISLGDHFLNLANPTWSNWISSWQFFLKSFFEQLYKVTCYKMTSSLMLAVQNLPKFRKGYAKTGNKTTWLGTRQHDLILHPPVTHNNTTEKHYSYLVSEFQENRQ